MTGTRGLTFIFVCILSVCLLFAYETQDLKVCNRSHRSELDEMFDEILEDVTEQIQDPRQLPDFKYGDFKWYPWEYSYSLTKGKLYGIKSLERCLTTAGFSSGVAATYHLEPSIKADRLSVDYNFIARSGVFNPEGTIKIMINDLRIRITTDIYEETNVVNVSNLEIVASKGPYINLHTTNPLYPDYLLSKLGNLILGHYKDDAIGYVKRKATELLASLDIKLNAQTRALIKGGKKPSRH